MNPDDQAAAEYHQHEQEQQQQQEQQRPALRATGRYTMGLTIRRQFRQYLQQQAFVNPQIRWMETKGWLSSQFVVDGPFGLIQPIHQAVLHANADEFSP